MMRNIVLLLGTLMALGGLASSCNLARHHVRACDRKLDRQGYAPHSFEDADGAHFTWYRDTGRPKLLVLHGYSGTGATQWHRTAKLLGEEYDLIMPDLLCHGRSTKHWRTDTTLYDGSSMAKQVAHVTLLLDSLGVKGPVIVVGNSYGGGVAAHFAERHPERVSKLVLYDALASDYSSAMADSIARSVGAKGMFAVMGAPSPEDLRYSIRLALYRDPPLPRFALEQIFNETVKPYRAAQATLIRDLMANEDQFRTKRYTWPMPVYIIWGERDELLPNSMGRAILQRNGIPEDHWSTVPRTGHVANIERPRAFDEALRAVLAK